MSINTTPTSVIHLYKWCTCISDPPTQQSTTAPFKHFQTEHVGQSAHFYHCRLPSAFSPGDVHGPSPSSPPPLLPETKTQETQEVAACKTNLILVPDTVSLKTKGSICVYTWHVLKPLQIIDDKRYYSHTNNASK